MVASKLVMVEVTPTVTAVTLEEVPFQKLFLSLSKVQLYQHLKMLSSKIDEEDTEFRGCTFPLTRWFSAFNCLYPLEVGHLGSSF